MLRLHNCIECREPILSKDRYPLCKRCLWRVKHDDYPDEVIEHLFRVAKLEAREERKRNANTT